MKTLDFIRLDAESSKKTVEALQQLLADYQVFYTNLRGLHWHVKGKNFFVLHEQFESLYNNAAEKVDEIAERILTLGKSPHSRFADYIKESSIKEIDTIGMEDTAMVEALIGDMTKLIEFERDILDATDEAGDDGTNDMVNAFMQFKEKTIWMLRSFLTKK